MGDVNNEAKENTSTLAPIPEKDRIMSWGSNTMLWLGGCISIGTLAMGSSQFQEMAAKLKELIDNEKGKE